MSSQDQEPVSSPNTQKRAPPPVPSRERRSTLGGPSDSSGSLPTLSNIVATNPQESSTDPEGENNNSTTIDDSTDQAEEGTGEFVEPEYVVEEIPPIELVNGEPLVDQSVAPRHYRHYIVLVSGNNDDVVDFRVSRTLRAGGTNIFVNAPRPEVSALKLLEPLKSITEENDNDEQRKSILQSVLPLFPTKSSHDWNPTKGVFLGPVGEYLISVEGIANFIEKDDKYLISPDSNWTNFDLVSEWTILDTETRKKLDEISSKYKKDKVNSVWSSSYSQEVGSKYESLLADYQLELERREAEQQESSFDFRKLDLQELLQVDLAKVAVNASLPLPGTSSKFSQKYQVASDNLDSTIYSVTKKVTSVPNPSEQFVAFVLDTRIAEESGIQAKLLLNQISLLKSPLPNLAHLADVFQSQNGILAFIYSNLPTVNLLNGVASMTQYNEVHARTVIRQLLDALQSLHGKNILHAAVAAENVFVRNIDRADEMFAVLHGIEFLRDTKDTDKPFGYPLQYQAPELIGNEGVSFATDLWALGCIAYLLLVGRLPFDDNNRIKLSGKIRQGNYEIPSSLSAEAQSLIKGFLTVEASKRLTIAAAKEHPWIKSSSSSSLSAVSTQLKSQ